MSDVADAPTTDPDTADPVVDDDDVREARRQREHARAVAGGAPLVPEIGVLPQAVRLLRVNRSSALDRWTSGAPLLDPAFRRDGTTDVVLDDHVPDSGAGADHGH